ncbi:MAG: S9 family peptidase [Gemmatimonadales bacterium]|nr:MAG: S9 family peptidase [Gemmatimonadales bacterium]
MTHPSSSFRFFRLVLAAGLLLVVPSALLAQVDPIPGGQLTAADYQRAEAFLSGNLETRLFRAQVSPVFHEGDRFWYRVRVPGGFEFVAVDPERGVREPAFDHSRLSAALSRAANGSFEAWQLPLTSLHRFNPGVEVEVEVEGTRFRCDLGGYECDEVGEPVRPPAGVTSPDGRYTAFRRDHDLWVFDSEEGEEIRLTTDGEERYGYASDSQGWRRTEMPILLWSPDSRRIATYRLDERGVEEMHLLRTAEPRPEHVAWPYALPGDSVVPMLERVVIHLEDRRVVPLETPPDHQRTSSCCGLARGQDWADVEWSRDGSRLAFVSVSRDYRTATLRVADPETGAVRTVLEESHPIFFESHVASGGVPNWRVLDGRREVLWFSQRDGWGHLFLYDLDSGALKNRITGGDWNVLDVTRVDPEAGTLHFTAVGREAGEDPYHRHLYRVGLDGSGLTRLTSESGDHEITLTPSGAFFVARVSTVEVPPVTTLRRTRDGGAVRLLEDADVSELELLGWRPPESFRAKGRDGVTDVYGLLIRPSHFDPEKRYPVVNAIYPGPQTGSVGTRGYAVSRRGQAHALAELGFIVVLVDALGSPLRSKAFHTAYYGDMGDNGLPDQIAAMRELASRHPWIDLDRAGIYGHSGGGFATAAALLRHPDFFHVGVSGAGNHDNRGYTYYWGEKYQGLLTVDEDGVDSYENQANHLLAENLRGRLLLSYGTMDTNVHPNTTLLLIDALVDANKDFDLLVLPNRGHGYANEPYAVRRTWDYFVEHLMGKAPPREYRIGG